MQKNVGKYRALNFDLKLKLLRENYPKKNILNAYKDIASFMKANGFSHRQWSGYRSNEKMSDQQVYGLMLKMRRELSWIDKCSTRIDVTNIEKTYDIKDFYCRFDEAGEFKGLEKAFAESEIKNFSKDKPDFPSFQERAEQAKQEALEYNMNRTHSIAKDFSKDIVL